MRRIVFPCVLALGSLSLGQQQPAPAKPAEPQQQTDDTTEQKPKRSLKRHLKEHFSSWCIGAPVSRCFDHQPTDEEQQQVERENGQAKKPQQQDAGPAKPAQKPDPSVTEDGESSSRSNIGDLTPPPSERGRKSEAEDDSADVAEVHKWDPHRAAKNVEVGDYYFNRGNYRAAQSRYEEALEYKANDAVATFRLAQTEEKLEQFAPAREHYQQYLKILPHGPFAEEAKSALARMATSAKQ